mmetsp:Transcript_12457/g.35963  ORF Transcript_12457/g.35963 Transcript_12457/m.35963 type:complete len:83 (-) Transcript_12457:364-612(-)
MSCTHLTCQSRTRSENDENTRGPQARSDRGLSSPPPHPEPRYEASIAWLYCESGSETALDAARFLRAISPREAAVSGCGAVM